MWQKKTGVSALGAFSIIVPVFNYFFSLPALNYSRCAIAHYQNSLVHFWTAALWPDSILKKGKKAKQMAWRSHCACGQPRSLDLLSAIGTLTIKFSSHAKTEQETLKNLLWNELEMLCISTGRTLDILKLKYCTH